MDSDHGYESILLVKNEVFVYKIPPLGTSRGYKAADWKLDSPDFVVRLKLVSRNGKLDIKLEDKATGEPFAKCPVDKYPGQAVEAVRDSSRYFVLRIADDTGKSAFIGIGFGDRGDSFDLNVALQDFFKNLAKDAKLNEEMLNEAQKPRLDLSFKEGQTITINLGVS
uniref:NECAP PHear domain-containing protein n=1 Tax=Romanomermis culicivorax TaxID=13658 RepID=A0A915ID26_ROMCU